MEYKKTIPVFALAICLSVMLLFADKGFLTPAYAQFTYTDVSTNADPVKSYSTTFQSTNYLAVMNVATDNESVRVFNLQTGATIRTISLVTRVGNGILQDMACINVSCFFQTSGTTAGAGSADVFGYNIATGDSLGTYNFTGGFSSKDILAVTSSDGVFFTVWSFVGDGSDVYYEVLSTDTEPFTRVVRIDTNTGNNNLWDATTATISGVNVLAFTISTGGGNQLQLWDRGTSTRICQATVSSALHQIINVGNSWYMADDEEVEIYSNACADTGTIASTEFCNAGGLEPIRSIAYSSFRDELYANCDESNANARVVVINLTTNTRTTNLFLPDNFQSGYWGSGLTYNRATDTLSAVISDDDLARIYYFGEPEQSGGGSSEFCSDPANANVLTCRLEDNSGAIVGSSELINQTSSNIICMIGFIPCTQNNDGSFTPDNPDIQTNGVGYLMWIAALGIMVGMFWVASRGQLSEIPTFLWFIGAIGITLVVTVIGWIDPTALIISVVTVIAFAVAKAKGILGGGGSLMNEQLQ